MKKSVKDDARAYILLSVMYAEKGDYRKAVCPAYFAVKTEKKPKSQYYNLLLVSHYELKDMNGSANILKEMVTYFPEEKNYWRQLSTLYLSMDKVKESLALMEMLYLKGGFESWINSGNKVDKIENHSSYTHRCNMEFGQTPHQCCINRTEQRN